MSRIPPKRRDRAARALRNGATQGEAAKAAGLSRRSITNLMHDPAFKALLEIRQLVTPGHVAAPVDVDTEVETDLLGGLPGSRAWVDVAGCRVIGSSIHPSASAAKPVPGRDNWYSSPAETAASLVTVEMCARAERVAEVEDALAAGVSPVEDAAAISVQLTFCGLLHVQEDQEDLGQMIIMSRVFERKRVYEVA